MSLEVYIGKNKSGKTKKLEEIKKECEDNKKRVLYIPSVINLKTYFEKEKSGTSKNDSFTPQTIVIDFINEIYSSVKEIKYSEEEIKNINKNIEKLTKLKSELSIKSENDIFFDNSIVEALSIIETHPETSKTKQTNLLSFVAPKGWEEESSSGSTNYSILKLLSEFIQWINITEVKVDLKNFVLIVDEAEKFSHPELIQKTADEILKISKYIDVTISTHSPQLVERIFNKSDDELEVNLNCLFSNMTNSTITSDEEKTRYKQVELSTSQSLKDFNYREVSAIVKCLFSTNVILVEGLADQDFIESLRKEYFEDNYVTIIDCNSRSGVEKIYEKMRDVKVINYINTLLFYDEDVNPGKNNLWNEPKKRIIVNGASSIVQVPDLEGYFFKSKCKRINSKKPKCKYEIKSEIKLVKKEDLKLTYEDIKNSSTITDVVERMKEIGLKIKDWVK